MRSFVDWYEREIAPGACRVAIERLPEQHVAVFDLDREDLGLLPNRWYPMDAVGGVLDHFTAGRDEEALWQLARAGKVVTTVMGPSSHKGVVEDWRGHHPLLCMFNVTIKRAIYEAMGCRGVRIESAYCVERGDSECGSVSHWDEGDSARST